MGEGFRLAWGRIEKNNGTLFLDRVSALQLRLDCDVLQTEPEVSCTEEQTEHQMHEALVAAPACVNHCDYYSGLIDRTILCPR